MLRVVPGVTEHLKEPLSFLGDPERHVFGGFSDPEQFVSYDVLFFFFFGCTTRHAES